MTETPAESGLSRRGMLRATAVTAAAAGIAALPGTAGAAGAAGAGGGRRVPREWIGIQLYTLRNALQGDLEGTLEALADIGYRNVELAGTYGRSAEEFRRILDRYGLRARSAHVGYDSAPIDQLIADAKILGYHRADHAYANFSTLAEWEDFARGLDAAGRALRKAGISYGYHNHAHEYQRIDGVRPIDVIASGTSRHNVHFEYDLYWVVAGGADPVEEYYRYFGRVKQYHVKDRAPDGSFANLGEGNIDFARIFRATWVGGKKDFIVEHDQPTDALHTAQVGYEYLRNLRF